MKSTQAGVGDLNKHLRPKGKKDQGMKDRIRVSEQEAVPAPQPIKTKRREAVFTVGAPVPEPAHYRYGNYRSSGRASR